jgi:hypothetical protein
LGPVKGQGIKGHYIHTSVLRLHRHISNSLLDSHQQQELSSSSAVNST